MRACSATEVYFPEEEVFDCSPSMIYPDIVLSSERTVKAKVAGIDRISRIDYSWKLEVGRGVGRSLAWLSEGQQREEGGQAMQAIDSACKEVEVVVTDDTLPLLLTTID